MHVLKQKSHDTVAAKRSKELWQKNLKKTFLYQLALTRHGRGGGFGKKEEKVKESSFK